MNLEIFNGASFSFEQTIFNNHGVRQTYLDESDGKYYNYYTHSATTNAL